MDVIGDLLARNRRSDQPALRIGDRERSYHELITNAYKAGNVLRYHGVSEGRTVATVPVPELPPILAFLGAAQLGAATRFDPGAGVDAGDRFILVPAAEQGNYEPPPGSRLAVFDGNADEAETVSWEESVWSENPAFPPTTVDPSTALLVGDREPVSHHEALVAATELAEEYELDSSSRVVLRSSLTEPGAIIAGLLTPLVVGGTAVLLGPETATAATDARGDVAVTTGDAPESVTIDPRAVPIASHDD